MNSLVIPLSLLEYVLESVSLQSHESLSPVCVVFAERRRGVAAEIGNTCPWSSRAH